MYRILFIPSSEFLLTNNRKSDCYWLNCEGKDFNYKIVFNMTILNIYSKKDANKSLSKYIKTLKDFYNIEPLSAEQIDILQVYLNKKNYEIIKVK